MCIVANLLRISVELEATSSEEDVLSRLLEDYVNIQSLEFIHKQLLADDDS